MREGDGGRRLNGKQFTAAADQALADAERSFLPPLTRLWQATLRKAADQARDRFALVAVAEDWQPPPEGWTLTAAEVAALGSALNGDLEPVWAQIVSQVASAPLARISIVWDVKHPVVQGQVEAAAQRTGERLGSAVQFQLREIIAKAYEEGLSVRDTSALIRSDLRAAASWQADMLARTDLNSLANGASRAAAEEAGMQFKTWDATLDAVTRPTHADAHGQTVPISDVFDVGGEVAAYPGDPALSDAEAANCRCTLVYGESLAEASGLLADAGSVMLPGMASATAHARKAASPPTDEAAADPHIASSRRRTDGSAEAALVADARPIGFSGVAAIEGIISDDNSLTPRVLLPDSLSWPEMPVPFMAQTVTAEGHDGAEVAGRVDEFSRAKGKGRTRSIGFAGELTTPFGVEEVAPMVADKTLRYVSADLGASEWAIVRRSDLSFVEEADLSVEDLSAGQYALGLRSAKMKAVTLVPTQALEGALVALTASAESPDEATLVFAVEIEMDEEALVAAPAPTNPPRSWFETPEPPGKMPLTILEDGRVYGHLATWDSCHVGFLPSCVPPPQSRSGYADFHVCELDCDDGSAVAVGKLMFSPTDGGHADRKLNANDAAAYYDRTGMVAAYLTVEDGRHGIWARGSLNPRLTDAQRRVMRRELRLNPPSGDWRPKNGEYELICALAVAVPGYPIPRGGAKVTVVASADGVELSEAIIASSGWFDADDAALAALESQGLLDDEAQAERRLRTLAVRAEGGMEALAQLVEGGA